jgi:hypothetical protein
MTVRATVTVNFEADSRGDAETKIAGWRLHEGCQVYASTTEQIQPYEADTTGKPKPVPEQAPPPRALVEAEQAGPLPESAEGEAP